MSHENEIKIPPRTLAEIGRMTINSFQTNDEKAPRGSIAIRNHRLASDSSSLPANSINIINIHSLPSLTFFKAAVPHNLRTVRPSPRPILSF